MGNHHSHRSQHKSGNSTPGSTNNSNGGSRKSTLSRKFSTASNMEETQQQQPPQQQISTLPPVEKLAKILAEKSAQEGVNNGITLNAFTKYLFPRYTILAEKLFNYMHAQAQSKYSYISVTAFKQQCEKYLAILDDDTIRDLLVRMFAVGNGGVDVDGEHTVENDNITPDGLRELLMCAYHVSMDHYSEGPQMCLSISKVLKAVVDSCFHQKNQLSCQFVSHWLAANCPRLLLPLHRYIVHSLATTSRILEDDNGLHLAAGLELATPVLEQGAPFEGGKSRHQHMLNMSMSWLLAGALHPIYSRPQKANSPKNSAVGLASHNFLTKLLCSVPSHWLCLYESNEQGLGANRFLHHVMGYKGPTLVLLKAEGGHVFCIASPNEWKESHLYWGSEEAALFQLLPKFLVLEKGAKMLYLNLSVRGYPHGLRAGKDPREPIISVDAGFDKIEFRKIPYSLDAIEVWGCGDPVSRETQLEIKKWEIKEAERQRCVKLSAADWLDHPDRYLLELAGRPQYHQSQNQPN